jgi:hypothetical protein
MEVKSSGIDVIWPRGIRCGRSQSWPGSLDPVSKRALFETAQSIAAGPCSRPEESGSWAGMWAFKNLESTFETPSGRCCRNGASRKRPLGPDTRPGSEPLTALTVLICFGTGGGGDFESGGGETVGPSSTTPGEHKLLPPRVWRLPRGHPGS